MKRVLVVDDEEMPRRATALGLRREGFVVEVAEGGSQALETLSNSRFDVVLVDLMMPQVNGLELARQIRARFPNTAVILTSAYPLSRPQIERLGLGDIGFIPKPSPMAELAERLHRLASGDKGRSGVPVTPTRPLSILDWPRRH